MSQEIEPKELSVVKTQSTKAYQAAQDIVIDSPESYEVALDLGKKIKQVDKMITQRKEEITKPLNEALKSARALFKPLEEATANAEAIVKRKMIGYSQEVQKKADAEKAKLAARVEKGTMKAETAVGKMQDIQTVDQTVKTDTARATIRKVAKFRIIDEAAIPREYLTPDMTKIRNAVITQRLTVPGVEFYEEDSMSIS